MSEYIKQSDAITAIHQSAMNHKGITMEIAKIYDIARKSVEEIPAEDIINIVRCAKCKYGTPLKAHCDGLYGLHCSIGRGEEVRNVWHKYSKHYEDYSIVDANGFCDQGEERE